MFFSQNGLQIGPTTNGVSSSHRLPTLSSDGRAVDAAPDFGGFWAQPAWTLICCAARACFNNSCTVERSYMATNVRIDHFSFTFCRFGSVVGQSWPQDPFKRVRLEK